MLLNSFFNKPNYLFDFGKPWSHNISEVSTGSDAWHPCPEVADQSVTPGLHFPKYFHTLHLICESLLP